MSASGDAGGGGMNPSDVDEADSDAKNRRLLFAFAVGGFIFVNILLAVWGFRRRSATGQRDQAIYAVTELGTAIATCSQSRGEIIPSAGPVPATMALASTPPVLAGDELFPPRSGCVPAKLPWAERWQFSFTRDDAQHGRIRARTDDNGDGHPDDAIVLVLACTGAHACKTEGTCETDPAGLAATAPGYDTAP